MIPVRKAAAILFAGSLLFPVFSGCSDSPLESREPVISDLVITPNPAKEGSVVTVTVNYFSPVQSPATGLRSALFAAGPTPWRAEARILIDEECWDCSITGQFVLNQARGTETVTVYALDADGRRSNGLSVGYTSFSLR